MEMEVGVSNCLLKAQGRNNLRASTEIVILELPFKVQTDALDNALGGVRAIGSRSHQVKADLAGCEITRGWLRNQPLAAKWCPSRCEISQPSCAVAKFS
ncbi:hypothetical protein CK203_014604 [Vitis vinifera]|uniref:Uncharacterized protein n=1 Tax=Vitis vinifera TaxID=29760 RepID=A0A438K4N7_VITVI|nr:hypothetical protein CK203_014604 [Vitis vinifera]